MTKNADKASKSSRDKLRQDKAKANNDLFRDDALNPNKKLVVTIPIAPSINHMYYHGRNGSKTLTKQALDYIRKATALINQAIDEQKWKMETNDVWYYMDLYIFMPDRKIRDSHNMLKLMLDVHEGISFYNDYFVMPRIQRVEYDPLNPRIELCLRPQTYKDRCKRHM